MLLTRTGVSDHITFHLPSRAWCPTCHSLHMTCNIEDRVSPGLFLNSYVHMWEDTSGHLCTVCGSRQKHRPTSALKSFHVLYNLFMPVLGAKYWEDALLNGQGADAGVDKGTGFVFWPFIVEFHDVSEPQVWRGAGCHYMTLPAFWTEWVESSCFVKPVIKALVFRSTQPHQWCSPASYLNCTLLQQV